MKINLSIECASLEEAVVTLGKLIGGRAARAAAAPLAGPTPADVVRAEQSAPAAPEAAKVEEGPPKKTRGPRSDRGTKRGPYVRGEPVEPRSSGATPSALPDASAVAEVVSPPSAAAEEPASLDEAQGALEAVFKSKGLVKAQEVLSRFGVARLRDLPADKYRPFVGLAKTALK